MRLVVAAAVVDMAAVAVDMAAAAVDMAAAAVDMAAAAVVEVDLRLQIAVPEPVAGKIAAMAAALLTQVLMTQVVHAAVGEVLLLRVKVPMVMAELRAESVSIARHLLVAGLLFAAH
jgi:hypothetical protein